MAESVVTINKIQDLDPIHRELEKNPLLSPSYYPLVALNAPLTLGTQRINPSEVLQTVLGIMGLTLNGTHAQLPPIGNQPLVTVDLTKSGILSPDGKISPALVYDMIMHSNVYQQLTHIDDQIIKSLNDIQEMDNMGNVNELLEIYPALMNLQLNLICSKCDQMAQCTQLSAYQQDVIQRLQKELEDLRSQTQSPTTTESIFVSKKNKLTPETLLPKTNTWPVRWSSVNCTPQIGNIHYAPFFTENTAKLIEVQQLTYQNDIPKQLKDKSLLFYPKNIRSLIYTMFIAYLHQRIGKDWFTMNEKIKESLNEVVESLNLKIIAQCGNVFSALIMLDRELLRVHGETWKQLKDKLIPEFIEKIQSENIKMSTSQTGGNIYARGYRRYVAHYLELL